MRNIRSRWLVGLGVLAVGIPSLALSQPDVPLSSRAQPKLVAVAETKLLMEAMAMPNYKGFERLLKGKPDDTEAWVFARGQSLLLAETANLLLLRPPTNQGKDAWNKSAIELREAATRLARSASSRDFDDSRSKFIQVTNACNRCHQSFRVATKLTPFQEEK